MNTNPRRRHKNLQPSSDEASPRHRAPAPAGAQRKVADKAAGSAWMFADFLAAMMTLPPEKLGELE